MSATSCGFAPVTSVGPVCGGHGVCQFDNQTLVSRCICEEGWQGESDFQVTNSLLDCQINVTAIKVLWAVCLVVHILVYVFVHIPKFNWLWKKHQTVAQRNKASGKVYRLWDNKGLFSLMPYLTVGWWSQLIFAIIKLVDQDQKIGSSVIITILYILWRTTFMYAPDTFQPALLASLLRSERNLDHVIRLNKNLSMLHMIFFDLLSILTIIPMVIPQDPLQPVVGAVSFAIFSNLAALSLFFLAIQAIYIEKKVKAILEASYSISRDERTRAVMEKIRINQREVVKGSFLQFLIYGIFGFSWIATANQIRAVIISLVQEEGDKSSSTQPTVSPNQDRLRKRVEDNPGSSGGPDSNQTMHVYGLELNPLESVANSSKPSFEEAGDPKELAMVTSVQISPAMRILRALTPSRKTTSPRKSKFNFEDGIGENNETTV